eukprot:scaffold133540_cov20-Tisochrysis_lutea.AAC.2
MLGDDVGPAHSPITNALSLSAIFRFKLSATDRQHRDGRVYWSYRMVGGRPNLVRDLKSIDSVNTYLLHILRRLRVPHQDNNKHTGAQTVAERSCDSARRRGTAGGCRCWETGPLTMASSALVSSRARAESGGGSGRSGSIASKALQRGERGGGGARSSLPPAGSLRHGARDEEGKAEESKTCSSMASNLVERS